MSLTRPEIRLECDLTEGLKGHACGDCPVLMKGKITQGFELKSYITNVTGHRYDGLILFIIEKTEIPKIEVYQDAMVNICVRDWLPEDTIILKSEHDFVIMRGVKV